MAINVTLHRIAVRRSCIGDSALTDSCSSSGRSLRRRAGGERARARATSEVAARQAEAGQSERARPRHRIGGIGGAAGLFLRDSSPTPSLSLSPCMISTAFDYCRMLIYNDAAGISS